MVCSLCKQPGHNKLKCPSNTTTTTKATTAHPIKTITKKHTNANKKAVHQAIEKGIVAEKAGVTYTLKIKSGYPPDGFHSYQPPVTRTEGNFNSLATANAACLKYVTGSGYQKDSMYESTWDEKKDANGCLCISVSAPDSEDMTVKVVECVHNEKTAKPTTKAGVTYTLKIKSGYPPDGFHSYQPPVTTTEGKFTDLAKANAACRKYITDRGYEKDGDFDSTWDENVDANGCLCISVSAADSEDQTVKVIESSAAAKLPSKKRSKYDDGGEYDDYGEVDAL